MAGKIQGADLKTVAELGGNADRLPLDTQIYVTANGINKTLYQAIVDQDIGAPPVALKETLTLSSTDISNGYVDLSAEALADSVDLHADRTKMFETRDYTLSIVSLVTRITFVNSFAAGGDNELQEGDVLYVEFIQA